MVATDACDNVFAPRLGPSLSRKKRGERIFVLSHGWATNVVEERGMLVLSRKIGEEIQIGSSVSLRVLGISGGRVKLGIAGPRAVRVARAELSDSKPVNDRRQTAGASLLTDVDP